ncbi:MAG: response regulator [Candidatus Aceula meridiana]|nr:response regulator [Candidatus Aceula meridiana]
MGEKKKILIIEDEEDIQKILTANLEAAGFNVVSASLAEEGFKLFEQEKPDVIILDVMLPDGNGFELCQRIKDTDNFSKIILYTGKLEAVDARRAREVGADDFTVKTVDFKYILESIRELTA